MVRKSNKGGYKRPTPNRENAVSGPGALRQRTDGTQPIMRGQDMGYGESAEYQNLQRSAPMGDSGGANMGLPQQAAPGPDVFAPTEIPGEPITAGVPVGEGMGPQRQIAEDVDILLSAMYSVNPHPVIADLINNRSQ